MQNPNVSTSPATARVMAKRLGSRKRILDLGCGDGVLLRAAAGESPDATKLVGIDLDAERLPISAPPRFEYIAGDALRLPDEPRFDGIISNPPYLSVGQLAPSERQLLKRAFSTLTGQYNLAFAFVEKAIGLLEEGGRGVFLLPEGLKTRPAAERLRQLLDQRCRWNTVKVRTRPYATDVGVEAEILWFDRTDTPKGPPEEEAAGSREMLATVSVGIATGANSLFIRRQGDPWLREIEQCFLRRFIRGRDIVGGSRQQARADSDHRLIAPYVVEAGELSPADEGQYPGLARFLDAHRGELGQGRHRGPGYFIQCPVAALIGERVVVPEVFREPRAQVAPDGVAVLNSAFILAPRPGLSARALAALLNSDATQAATLAEARRLGSGYQRITSSGLRGVLGRAGHPMHVTAS